MKRARLLLLAKLAVALLAFAFILSQQSWDELRSALLRLSPWSLLLAVALQGSGLVIGASRWRSLMVAYGASVLPPFTSLLRCYAVGDFYNTYVPGAVGGDILRGVVTRRSFAHGGREAGAFAVVLIERCLGLCGVLILTALAAVAQPDTKLGQAMLPSSLVGLGILLLAIVAITHGRRFAPLVPRRLRPTLASLPRLQHVAPFVLAALLSLATQIVVVLCGHTLLASLTGEATLADSFLALPMAVAAGFFPLSVAGVGPRDVALVALYGMLGIPQPAATATAIGLSLVVLIVAGTGGVIQLFAPLSVHPPVSEP